MTKSSPNLLCPKCREKDDDLKSVFSGEVPEIKCDCDWSTNDLNTRELLSFAKGLNLAEGLEIIFLRLISEIEELKEKVNGQKD